MDIPIDHEQVAADPATHRFDDAEHGVRSDGRIDGISTGFKYVQSGLGRERLTGRDDSVLGDDGGPGLLRIPGGAVVLGGAERAADGENQESVRHNSVSAEDEEHQKNSLQPLSKQHLGAPRSVLTIAGGNTPVADSSASVADCVERGNA
ncbi:MAG: hypothetical protein U0992_09875 [Planctomycetaceae bacterium]